ncbi:MAG TPA: DUF1015 domain-containing protein [Treponema sp.]|nr:DUF1015 domain-containing protein [Treponema sp.]
MKTFSDSGILIPDILLPKNIDLKSWSVIACDQYTQDRAYWEKAAVAADGKPSTINLILPEVYLSDSDKEERIARIKTTMQQYIADGVFAPAQHGFIYVERRTAYGRVRHGLVAAVDLETYEWKPFSKSLVRATEATIVERIPPRREIRNGAPLELPHIMLLVNDPERVLVEGTGSMLKADGVPPVYDGDLMLNGGSITGRVVPEKMNGSVLASLDRIAEANTAADGSTFLFAAGDGNHSLATAKAVWDEYKTTLNTGERGTSRVRYALVEIVNIYDTGLTFEPIHRVLFGADTAELIAALKSKLGGSVSECGNAAELENAVKSSAAAFGFVHTEAGKTMYELLSTPVTELAVAHFQPVVDEFIKTGGKSGRKITIDYIHGGGEVMKLGSKPETTGILLPPVDKDSFFATISSRGPLPRKSFSMGEADEKRFYLECRKLF